MSTKKTTPETPKVKIPNETPKVKIPNEIYVAVEDMIVIETEDVPHFSRVARYSLEEEDVHHFSRVARYSLEDYGEPKIKTSIEIEKIDKNYEVT